MVVRKKNEFLSFVNMMLVDLPSPSSLSYMWNFGSLLGLFLMVQLISGIFLAIHFSGDVNLSFFSMIHIMRDVNFGWLIRIIHANGASMFFLLMYIHIGRGLYYGSFLYKKVWLSGVSIFLVSMVTAFLGYVLPWGQMSFWAATVITNLLSVVPYLGVTLVEWIWGGYAVGNPTLVRFFSFHFILPFIILVLVLIHLLFLHEFGSNNPLGLNSNMDKVEFHPYYIMKDLLGVMVIMMMYMMLVFQFPYMFMDVENFIMANPLVTPIHIQPEWYFLFAYCILRSVPNKLGGVLALVMSVLILYLIPFIWKFKFRSFSFLGFKKFLYWYLVLDWVLLTWLGSCVVEYPFVECGKVFSLMYFLLFLMIMLLY